MERITTNKPQIKLVFRQMIDANSKSNFEKAIFRASYQEFLMKSQAYNSGGAIKTFSKLIMKDSKANSLHYKLSFAVLHFIEHLGNKIPIIKDSLGNKLDFGTVQLELIESHTEDISLHKVALKYQTHPLTLIEVFGDYLLLTRDHFLNEQPVETFMLKMQPDMAIISYHENPEQENVMQFK